MRGQRGTFYVPEGVHPIVRQLFETMNDGAVSLAPLSAKSGVNAATIQNWRNKQRATLDNIDAVFNALGYKLSVTKIEEGAV